MHTIKTTWTKEKIPHDMVHLISPDVLAATIFGQDVPYSQVLNDNADAGFVAERKDGQIVCTRFGRIVNHSYETIPEAQIQFWASRKRAPKAGKALSHRQSVSH